MPRKKSSPKGRKRGPAAPPEPGKRSPVGRSPARAGAERDALGRLQTALTELLVAQLCETHREGRDFRNATALRCGVHPKMLTRWLKQGETDPAGSLCSRLFMAFGRIEGDIRAEWIAEVANPVVACEETRRSTNGLQWLLERRFRQFRADWIPRPDEVNVGDMLTAEQQTGFSPEAALAIVRAMVASMPAELAGPFMHWARARLPVGVAIDGNDEQHEG